MISESKYRENYGENTFVDIFENILKEVRGIRDLNVDMTTKSPNKR